MSTKDSSTTTRSAKSATPEKDGDGTPLSFYILMGVLAIGLLYFLAMLVMA